MTHIYPEAADQLEAQAAGIAELKTALAATAEAAATHLKNKIAADATQAVEIARLREALEYMLRAWDREVGPDDDILLMVKDGAKIRSVQCARKALEQKP